MTQRRQEDPDAPLDKLADLAVDGVPPDAPERGSAAVDTAPVDPDPAATAHDPEADRGARTVLAAYAAALSAGDAAQAADLFAEQGTVWTEGEQHPGREAVRRWHEQLLAGGAVRAEPAGQGNDTGRLEVHGVGGVRAVELAFDASGRIGSARWLAVDAARLPQEERTRRAL
jgi:ketosteroid isomerase-like protein